MTTPKQPDPLSHLAQSLAADYEQSREAQRDRVIAELQQVIERVPEQSEFTNTRRYQVLGPILTLISLALLAFGIVQGKTGLLICGAFMSLLFALVTWQHRNAGQQPFMRLTRRQLFVDSLSAPVELADVVDIYVKDEGLLTLQKLTLSPTAALPTHRAVRQVFGNQAMAFKKPEPHIRIHSAGLMSGGSKLDCDDTAALLDAYVQAAHAQRQLDTLRQDG
ncbi:hypothetical protein SAMN05216588_11162 [Pseudomonas flavescens]|uniref:Uncharacterized protein n=1 Tax=Phytopseudomonas flavescens TaxID=29435 RepID=A0A1G8HR77_9GAMM|nr:hypothetical protein [Pseudomonas flavescens]SDI08991.1 hypothetical protein SAMN05216588_11162 [Pseudomonas flavescens]